MDFKVLALFIMVIVFVFELWVQYLDMKASEREIPNSVKDIYDKEEYERWLSYHKEKCRISLISHCISSLAMMVLIIFDVYAKLLHMTGVQNVYIAAIFVTILDIMFNMLWSVPISYKNNMGIEQKYGFNRMTKKTFVIDIIKDFLINTCIMCGLICLFILIHKALGSWLLVVFTGVMLLVLLVMVFISPLIAKIYNKLEPLPEGELRSRLTELLESNGCTVKDIKVSDGSKRSSKANAYFSGFGKMKTIVLFDTLLEQMTEDEIVAVFAHEMGHNKHKDTLKMYVMNILNIVIMVVIAWALVTFPEIYSDFGFGGVTEGVEYGFAFVLCGICLSLLSPIIGLYTGAFSRKFEYAADRFAAENGYGEALITGLKKLAKNTLSCLTPHPLVVKLTYSHPTISQRVEALEKVMKK